MSGLTTMHYGSEAIEYALSRTPKVGDVLTRNGDTWVVIEIKEGNDGKTTVVLEPGLKPAGI